jgi:NADH-quinone oxidoreductase subunit N
LFFLYDTKYIKTLNEFKNLNITSSTTNIVVLSLLSMAGMPPLLGFFGKFLIILFFLKKAQFFLFIVFIFINLFVIYFYILNIRFLISKSTKHFFFIKGFNVYFNFPIVALFLFLFLLNFFGIFFLNDLIIFCNSICYFYF